MIGCVTCGGQPPLCDQCLDASEAQLRGVAASRGYWWADSVAARVPVQPWPSWDESERVREIAMRKVADLTRDEQLRERLARLCHAEALRSFDRLARTPQRTLASGIRPRRTGHQAATRGTRRALKRQP